MWFELYEIPTGSMRPTLEEKDRLVVSKTAFGINIPLKRGHFYFDPNLIHRNQTVIFTGAGMDIHDVNTVYFYLFPGKKQFVKRLIGKPGDLLYFYGGQIYGIDKNGNDISNELNPPSLARIDHVPYIYFNGRMEVPAKPTGGIYSPITIRQMNIPCRKNLRFPLLINPQEPFFLPLLLKKTILNFGALKITEWPASLQKMRCKYLPMEFLRPQMFLSTWKSSIILLLNTRSLNVITWGVLFSVLERALRFSL